MADCVLGSCAEGLKIYIKRTLLKFKIFNLQGFKFRRMLVDDG